MQTCTWAPTTFSGTKVVKGGRSGRESPRGKDLTELVKHYAAHVEQLGIDNLLIAQRWWGDASSIEGSSLDCLAMTSWIAGVTSRVKLITAIHPGFFQPTAIAKWGATMDALSNGRWAINVTSGWNLQEFDMYGIDALDHDERYRRTAEFIDVLKGAWSGEPFSHDGEFYQTNQLVLEPRPAAPLEVFQGGQSPAAIAMACEKSDWMFLNGGSIEKLKGIIARVREQAAITGRCPRFAVYAIPLCRETDAKAIKEIDVMIENIDDALLEERRARVSGATGMWSDADRLSMLDTNEGYATNLIGSPDTVLERIEELQSIGVDMLHLMLGDSLFETEVLPRIR